LRSGYLRPTGNIRFKWRPFRGMLRLLRRILLIIVFIELIRIVISGFITRPVVAKWGTIEKGFWTEALFLREEKIYTAPAEGKLAITVEEGAMIPEGELLAYIESKDDSGTEGDIYSSTRLESLHREENTLNQDLNRVTAEVGAKHSLLVQTSSNAATLERIKEDLAILEKEKGRILRSIHQTRERIKKLNSAAATAYGKRIITAAGPGYLFYQSDGWEEQLRPERYRQITRSDLRRNYPLRKTRRKVNAGEFIGKIIHPFNQRIVIEVNPDRTRKPVIGDRWWVKNHDNLFGADIIYCNRSADQPQTTLVTLSAPGIGQKFLPERRARIFMVYRRLSGVSVPVRALFRTKNDTYVKVLKGDEYRRQQVRVLETDSEQAIIEGLEFGSTIISR
jgi:putative membrane fusion protein